MRTSLAFGTGKSVLVKTCQSCNNSNLFPIISLGYMPPVNTLKPIGTQPNEQPSYPSQLLFCNLCNLVQIGLVVDPKILFSSDYPYTSGTTKILRDNFEQLYKESSKLIKLNKDDLLIDIGSNDGTLLENFKNSCKVLGITPEKIGKIAIKKGIPTIIDYFNKSSANKAIKQYGKATVITAANVFAHIENVHEVIDNILSMLKPHGIFISESHYLLSLLKTLQYDTIYHEHLRYYSLHSIIYLLRSHNLEVFHAVRIPTHGGSIRVYAAKKGTHKILPSVKKLLKQEKPFVTNIKTLYSFRRSVTLSKLELSSLLLNLKKRNKKIVGISAPSRATTLINYCGIDDNILDCVVEVKGSYKIGNYIPGTLIPIVDENYLFKNQPDYALLLSWHIAAELIPKLKKKGYKGDFIVPLPKPKIIYNRSVII